MSNSIYLGRIVAVAQTPAGKLAACYRVSSRSFPNRRADVAGSTVRIVPKEGHEGDVYKNPYIAYNCATVVDETGIVTNGSHTDPIAERIASGMSIRDALVFGLAVMDYEKDDYNTPRIAAVVRRGSARGWLGVVREDGLDVRGFELAPGQAFYVSTYEHNVPCAHYACEFGAATPDEACAFLLGQGAFANFTNPVTAVSLVEAESGFKAATADAPQG